MAMNIKKKRLTAIKIVASHLSEMTFGSNAPEMPEEHRYYACAAQQLSIGSWTLAVCTRYMIGSTAFGRPLKQPCSSVVSFPVL